MGTMKNWIFGAAVLAGAAALGSTPAQAAEFGIYVCGPVAYVPPCPGPGYVWTAGYMANGYWIPGRWNFGGDRGRFVGRDDYRHDRGHDFDRNRAHDRFRW